MLGMESKLYKKEKGSSIIILKSFGFSSAKGWYKYAKSMRACSSYYIQADLKSSVPLWYAYLLFLCEQFAQFLHFNPLRPTQTYQVIKISFLGTEAVFFWSLPLWLNSTSFPLLPRNPLNRNEFVDCPQKSAPSAGELAWLFQWLYSH